MWECSNCREQIEDRYKHCWNCGESKPDAGSVPWSVKVQQVVNTPPTTEARFESPPPKPFNEPPPKSVSEPAPKPVSEPLPPVDKTSPADVPPIIAAPRQNQVPFEKEVFFEEKASFEEKDPVVDELSFAEKSPSKIGQTALLVLWLAAVAALGWFAYHSSQKTTAFENRLAEEAQYLNAQASAFAFSPNAPREKRGGAVKAKVLPMNAQNKQLDPLYYALPDDLRPATLDEAQTVLWLDCRPREVWRYDDGSPGFRENCNAYLVDRNTSKILQVEEFPGEMPPLKKPAGNSAAAPGRVSPSTYISYIRANQPEAERKPFALATDSPAHHVWFKSELIYALILLALLAAIGIGWIIYQIKSVVGRRE